MRQDQRESMAATGREVKISDSEAAPRTATLPHTSALRP